MIKLAMVGLGLAIILLVFTPVHGETVHSFMCKPAATFMDGKPFVRATPEQWRFAQGVYVAQPETPVELTTGDGAWLLDRGDDTLVIFTDGDQSCAQTRLLKDGAKALRQIKSGELNHQGSPT